jgi:hypothetical protein
MPRPTRKQLETIIKDRKLDLDVVERRPRRKKPRTDAGTPELAELKQRFLGADAPAEDLGVAGLDDEDLGTFEVKPSGTDDDDDTTPGRTTVMSGSLGKPIAEQG